LEQALEDALDPEGSLSRQVEALLGRGGMSNVLAAGELLRQAALSARAPWDEPDDEDEPRTGFALLLAEARQQAQEGQA
jgi:hypothetical protein